VYDRLASEIFLPSKFFEGSTKHSMMDDQVQDGQDPPVREEEEVVDTPETPFAINGFLSLHLSH
jgi:hypothetical protein